MSEGNAAVNPSDANTMNEYLEDDRADRSKEFNGATLAISAADRAEPTTEVEFKGTGQSLPDLSQEAELRRDRPFSASMRSTVSTKSVTSMNPHVVQSELSVKTFFSYRQGSFENAVEHCEKLCVKSELDGVLRGAWLLNEIDHWDNEREKVVLLTDNSLLVCRYDFIAGKFSETRRVLLHGIDTLISGDFIYPEKSVMPPRKHGGIKISWAKGQQPTLGQRWNPFSKDIPYLMFAHHPIIYHQKERETVTYNVDDFYESLIQAINQVNRVKNPGKTVTVLEEAILIESYANIASQVFNQSGLGFFKERGGVSF